MNAETGMTRQDTAVLKGVAIILMVFHHCFRTKSIFKGYEISFAPLSRGLVVNLCAAAKICVPIFAFISGYGLALSIQSQQKRRALDGRTLSRWYSGRYFKLMAGYWFIYLLYAVVGQLFGGRFTGAYFGDGVLKGMVLALFDFLGISNLLGTPILGGAWWYMSCAIVIVLLVPLFVVLIQHLGTVCVVAGLFLLPRILCLPYPMYDTPYHFIFAALLGVVFAEHDLFAGFKGMKLLKNKAADTVLQAAGLLAVIALLYVLQMRLDVAAIWEVKHGLFPLAVILFVVKFISPIPGVHQVLAFLGRYSMNIFLVHLLLRAYFKSFFFSLGHFLLVGLALLLASLLLSVALEWVKKQLHYQKLIQALTELIYRRFGLNG